VVDDAAGAAASDTSALDSTLASQDAAPAEQDGKSRAGGDVADDGTMDPTTLALLLASNGTPVTALAGSNSQTAGNQDNENDSNPQRSAGVTAAAEAAAGALAASLALTTATASGNGSSAQTGSSSATTAVADATGPSAAPTDPSLLAALNSLQVGASDAATATAVLGTDSASGSSPSAGQPATAPTGATTFHAIANGMQGVTAAAAQTTAVERSISTPMTDRNWSGEVAGQVQWMVNNNIQSATLQLSPEHLGPVEIHIDVQASQVNVTFSAAHPDTRSALEQTVPQLRSLMASGGLTLGQTSVQHQQTRSGSSYASSSASSTHASSKSVESVTFSPSRGLGLIDEYA
jgi:flagellar hook-length control protein FliK